MKKVLEGRGVLRALGCRSGLVCCVSSGPQSSVKPETGIPSLFFYIVTGRREGREQGQEEERERDKREEEERE